MAETDEPRTTSETGTTGAPGAPGDSHAAPSPSRRGLTIVLVVLGLFAATMVTFLVTRGDSTAPTDDVASALASRAPSLVGRARVGDLQHTRCVKADVATDFICKPVADTSAVQAITVRWKDGKLTRKLEGSNLKERPRAEEIISAALSLDDQALYGSKTEYGCAFSPNRTPNGGTSDQGLGGYICVSKKPDPQTKELVQRYVEFADDGTLVQDFPTSL